MKKSVKFTLFIFILSIILLFVACSKRHQDNQTENKTVALAYAAELTETVKSTENVEIIETAVRTYTAVKPIATAENSSKGPAVTAKPSASAETAVFPDVKIEEAADTKSDTEIEIIDEDPVDFVLDFPEGEEITIIQLSDMQMQDYYGARNETRVRQTHNAFFNGMSIDHQVRVWQYVDEAVAAAQPDIIVLIGDNVYGELDNDGEMWTEMCEKIDSYGVPWLVVFGNHDNESAKGVMWQIEQLNNTKHCIFKQGNVTGNSNYNVLITQGGKAKYLFYMLDTNGCRVVESNPGEGMMPDNIDIDKITQTQGLADDQIKWMHETAQKAFGKVGEIPVLIFMHIPSIEYEEAAVSKYSDKYSVYPFCPGIEGDFGTSYSSYSGFSTNRYFWNVAKAIGCKGIFVGHLHKVATSIVYEGIRLTHGIKTGTYDSHSEDLLGATKISLSAVDETVSVEYLYSKIEYKKQ